MWAGRRDEAFRRAVDLAELARLMRSDAGETRQVAVEAGDDKDSRTSLERTAADYDLVAEGYQRSADTYLDIIFNSSLIQQDQDQDDDGDGFW